jgi:hypothetical protein
MYLSKSPIFRIIAVLAVLSMPIASYAADLVGKPSGGGTAIDWQLSVSGHEAVELTVVAPNGDSYTKRFPAGKTPSVRLLDLGSDATDGQYNYQLRVVPKVPSELRGKLEKARATGDDAAARKVIREAGLVAPEQTGSFTILNGSIVTPGLTESTNNASAPRSITTDAATRPTPRLTPSVEDQVIADDLIVQGSICAGFDCVSGESFGFDTIRMKENSTRVKFEDTSVGSFPSNDWQLTANDSAGGGANKFSIEDITGSKVPVTVTAGASTNSLFIDSSGRIGFRTSTPLLDLHVSTSNTPALRLEQTSAGGFTAQTWDVAGNEANFFVRDLTSGSRLPFRIRPGAPTSSIDISASGNVGIGTASPSRALHVIDTGASDNTVLEIQNDAAARIRITNSANAETWNLGHQSPSGSGFVLSDVGDAVSEMLLDVAGNMTIAGTLTQGSSRAIKHGFATIDPANALAGVQKLPILTWVYNDDATQSLHVGPMAEEFHAAFGFGADDKHIAPSDQAGLALAAIKGLAQVVEQKDQKIQELEARLQQLEKQMASTPKN